MRYLLLCYDDEAVWDNRPESEQQQIIEETRKHVEQLKSRDRLRSAAPLHPTSMATSVRVREGKRLVTDGPFAETREQLGGFYVIDANNLDEAIEIGARHPGARWGTVEIRPIREIPGLPNG
jgi:hypothetical protein